MLLFFHPRTCTYAVLVLYCLCMCNLAHCGYYTSINGLIIIVDTSIKFMRAESFSNASWSSQVNLSENSNGLETLIGRSAETLRRDHGVSPKDGSRDWDVCLIPAINWPYRTSFIDGPFSEAVHTRWSRLCRVAAAIGLYGLQWECWIKLPDVRRCSRRRTWTSFYCRDSAEVADWPIVGRLTIKFQFVL